MCQEITMTNRFDDFYAEIEAEAKAEGPEAVRDLRAKELKYSFLNALMTARRARHLTQQQLAAQSGIAQEEISRIERGRKSPTLDTYSRLAAALDLQFLAPRPRRSQRRRVA
jgi:ribosome-binding protein aMBF1 (putative translation factor)